MDGENHGKPYEQMDDLGGKNPLFLETPKLEINFKFIFGHYDWVLELFSR